MSDIHSVNRRDFFDRTAGGLQGAALAWLLAGGSDGRARLWADDAVANGTELIDDAKPRAAHFEPRAKAVIHLFMNGGPSQMDLFDPKPVLDKHHGEPYFDKIAGDVENIQSAGALLRSPFKFAQHGQSGLWVSDALPHIARQVDNLAMIRSMHTTNLTHEPALYLIQTGRMGPGHPSLASWVVYGFGSENPNLPSYVVLADPL